MLAALPGRDVKLGALVSGRIAEIAVAQGDRVRKGELLVRIEDAPLRAALAQGQASLRQATTEREVARLRASPGRTGLQGGRCGPAGSR